MESISDRISTQVAIVIDSDKVSDHDNFQDNGDLQRLPRLCINAAGGAEAGMRVRTGNKVKQWRLLRLGFEQGTGDPNWVFDWRKA